MKVEHPKSGDKLRAVCWQWWAGILTLEEFQGWILELSEEAYLEEKALREAAKAAQ